MKKGIQASDFYSFKEFFLIEFTKELIRHSLKGEFLQLKRIIEEDKKKKRYEQEEKALVKEIRKQGTEPPKKYESIIFKGLEEKTESKISTHTNFRPLKIATEPFTTLRMLEPQLPPSFQYLQPYPTSKEMELGKLDSLIRDRHVQTIECNGPYEPLMVSGTMGRKPTDMIFSPEEVKGILEKFSRASRIPLHTGIYRVVVGKLLLIAIISEVINSKFIIKKINTPYPIKSTPKYIPSLKIPTAQDQSAYHRFMPAPSLPLPPPLNESDELPLPPAL